MTVSFIHYGHPEMGSYRLRAMMPAQELGWSLNDYSADILILSKPREEELSYMDTGKIVIADFCDPHFVRFAHYRELVRRATAIVCSSEILGQIIASQGRVARVIPDCWDIPESKPHVNGTKIVWFGHRSNLPSILRVKDELSQYELRILTNTTGYEQLTNASRDKALEWADICIFPATELYKNPNRAVVAARAGCLVVAEPHPAYVGFPCYVGNIKEGIEWARKNPEKATQLVRSAQDYVCERYSPKTVASAWKVLIQSLSTLGVAGTNGKDGLTSILPEQTLTATYENFPLRTTMRMPPSQSMSLNTSTNGKLNHC